MELNVLDLFCGCGGLSYGFLQAGFDVLLGIDNDNAALNTFKNNHKGAKAENINLADDDICEKIDKLIENKNVDVIIGGPPCQGFSLTGPRNFYDKRNKLYLAMVSTVKYFKPKAFLIENVTGMATLYGGEVKNKIIECFTDLGYNVNVEVVCAADYGVPQIRKRLVFVGVRNDIGTFKFPEKIKTPENYVSCEEALSDLPSLELDLGEEVVEYTSKPLTEYQKKMRKNSRKLHNHVATNHTEEVKSVISLVPEGGNYKDLPPGVGTSRKFNEAWTRYHSKKPSRTIDTGHRNHFHYKYNRVPTVRENARLQSFPDDFVFYGTKTQQNRQVGNAVPPMLSYNLAKQLKKYIIENDEKR
mgnify:CR=1 FL=1